MSCGCNKKRNRVKHNTVNHSDILVKLRKGVVKIISQKNNQNSTFLCTHYEESLPSKNSKNYRNINQQHRNNDILVWAFNKNPNKNIEPKSGWVRIPLSEIIHYELIDEVKTNNGL